MLKNQTELIAAEVPVQHHQKHYLQADYVQILQADTHCGHAGVQQMLEEQIASLHWAAKEAIRQMQSTIQSSPTTPIF